jgi:hypothetical protein
MLCTSCRSSPDFRSGLDRIVVLDQSANDGIELLQLSSFFARVATLFRVWLLLSSLGALVHSMNVAEDLSDVMCLHSFPYLRFLQPIESESPLWGGYISELDALAAKFPIKRKERCGRTQYSLLR